MRILNNVAQEHVQIMKAWIANGSILGISSISYQQDPQIVLNLVESLFKIVLLGCTIGYTIYQWQKAARK